MNLQQKNIERTIILMMLLVWTSSSLICGCNHSKEFETEKKYRATNELLQWLAWAPIEFPPARKVSNSDELFILIPKLIKINSRYRKHDFDIEKFMLIAEGNLTIVDSWNRRIEIFQSGKVFELRSAGADGEFFTDDDIVMNWLGGLPNQTVQP